jgi:hypothetical protein
LIITFRHRWISECYTAFDKEFIFTEIDRSFEGKSITRFNSVVLKLNEEGEPQVYIKNNDYVKWKDTKQVKFFGKVIGFDVQTKVAPFSSVHWGTGELVYHRLPFPVYGDSVERVSLEKIQANDFKVRVFSVRFSI